VNIINIRSEHSKPRISKFQENTLDVTDIHPPSYSLFEGRRGFGRYFNYLACIPTISKIAQNIIDNKKIDYVYSYMPGIGSSLPAMRIASKNKIKHVLDFADLHVYTKPRFLAQKAFKNSDKIITITDYLKQYLIKKGIDKEKIKIIPNGVNLDLFNPEKYDSTEINDLRNSFDAEKLVVFSGALQDLNIIIDAAEQISKKTNNIKFLIVGDHRNPTKSKEAWESKVKAKKLVNSFIFLGSKPHNEVSKFILCGDVCVDSFPDEPYYAAAHPLKLLEYGACKKPIVASSVHETKNLIKHGYYGLLAEPGNSKEFSDHILTLINDNNLREKISLEFYNHVKKNYEWKKIAKDLENFLLNF
jgi:glycosyltransferase involved in cell wall biosynthesis